MNTRRKSCGNGGEGMKVVLAVVKTLGLVLLLPLFIVLGAVVGSLSMAVSVMFEWFGIIWCDVWRNKE